VVSPVLHGPSYANASRSARAWADGRSRNRVRAGLESLGRDDRDDHDDDQRAADGKNTTRPTSSGTRIDHSGAHVPNITVRQSLFGVFTSHLGRHEARERLLARLADRDYAGDGRTS